MVAVATFLFACQKQGLLERVVPHPTGRNGYEEYLQAADTLLDPMADVYAKWTPGMEPRDGRSSEFQGPSSAVLALDRHLNSLTPLDVRREELQRFGQALQLVHKGNGKPVYDPRPRLGPDTLFPEYSSFRAVTRFAVRAASVYAASGRTDRAVDILLDQLAFADNFGRSVMIANLVGTAGTTTTLAAFADLFPRLSRTDAIRIQRTVDEILARPAAARAVLPAELAFTKAGLQKAFNEGEGKSLFSSSDDDMSDSKAKAMANAFDAMPRSDRLKMLRRVEARVDARALAMDRVLAGPERGWAPGIAALAGEDEESPPDLDSALVAMLTPAYSGYVGAAVRSRTQLRLLGLHARLLQQHWNFGRYPESLDFVDPLTDEPYVYEKHPDGTIRLASKGIPQTGEIELRYVRPASEPEKGTKP